MGNVNGNDQLIPNNLPWNAVVQKGDELALSFQLPPSCLLKWKYCSCLQDPVLFTWPVFNY